MMQQMEQMHDYSSYRPQAWTADDGHKVAHLFA